ncbi:MAG: thioredoxin family protein [Gammaproteobacteria bacterium]|nr:thioredoxin family protein [Gammaproteobacteria bacterium]
MSVMFYVVVGVVSAVLLYQFSFYFSLLRMRGRRVVDMANTSFFKPKGRVLLYFYSDRCAPCRDMTLLVDGLMLENNNVVKLNVQHDAVLARALGIRATPTFVVVDDGKVSNALLGAQSIKKLRSLLKRVVGKTSLSSVQPM